MTGALLVIAPHADDELLGAAVIMARAQAAGDTIGVVYLTDGAASDPGVDGAALAAARRAEALAGLAALLGSAPDTLFLDAPDGRLDSATVSFAPDSALHRFVAALAPSNILVTDPADAHPDHKAAFGLASRIVSAGFGERLQVMPVSQRVDGVFAPAGYTARPVGAFAEAKAAALACHRSQLDTATGFTLSAEVRADFNAVEYLRTAYDRTDRADDAVAAGHFDAMFDRSADPWGYDDTPYERDRFARTVAALVGRRYRNVLELGCANGALTEQLAPLCDRLLATDASASALASARERLAGMTQVTVQQAALPDAVPTGPFDLIVASDLLYYLGLDGVVAAMRRLAEQATGDGRMLIASYLGETDTRLTGEMASEAAIAHLPGWRRSHVERTDRLRIDVLDRG